MLTDTERETLEFAGLVWRHAGERERAIRERFDISATRYFQRVNALLDRPEALEAFPMTVNRLRRLRALNARDRARVS